MNAIQKESGLYTQIRTLKKRIDSLDMNKVNPAELKSAIDSLKDLESRYADMQEKKKQRKLEKETKEKEMAQQKESAPAPNAPITTADDAPNIPCVKCGRSDLPLHTDYMCPECSPKSNTQEAAPADTELVPPVEKESEVHTEATSSNQDVIDAFLERSNPRARSAHLFIEQASPDVWNLVNYNTVIATIEGDTVKLNYGYYSITTRIIQNKIWTAANQMGLEVVDPKTGAPLEVPKKVKKKIEPTIHEEAPVQDAPTEEAEPFEKAADVSKFALDDIVEPVYGTAGSYGRVMRYDADKDMAYVHWDSGKLKDDHGFGAYKGSDLRKRASKVVLEASDGRIMRIKDLGNGSFAVVHEDTGAELALFDSVKEAKDYIKKHASLETEAEIWQLESPDEEFAAQLLSNIAQKAIDGDTGEQEYLRSLWDGEKWESIAKKLQTEGSVWYVWWMDGVHNFMRQMQDEEEGQVSERQAADESAMDTKCESCGKVLGPEVFLSQHPVCGACTKKRHKQVTNPSDKRSEQEVTDKVRCNMCQQVFPEETEICPKCKTDKYMMQPFMPLPEDKEAAGDGIGYGGDRPGINEAPKRDEDVSLNAATPSGWKKTVEKMKKHKDINNPFALSWWMKEKGYEPKKSSSLALKAEWAVEYFPNDSDKLKIHKGFQSKEEAEKWVKAENIHDRGTDVSVYQVKEAALSKEAKVVHKDDGWHVLSEEGKNLGGPYDSKEKAVKRLRQVEYFKHHKGALNAAPIDPKYLHLADEEIAMGSDIAHEVAVEHGQMYRNVQDMKWFREAVARELQEMHEPNAPAKEAAGQPVEGQTMELNIANRKWTAKRTSGAGSPDAWVIFDDNGQQVMAITMSERELSQPELEQIVFNELGKKDLVRATLKENLSIMRKGHKVRIVAIDLKRKEVKFASLESKSLSGWTKLDKFDMTIEAEEREPRMGRHCKQCGEKIPLSFEENALCRECDRKKHKKEHKDAAALMPLSKNSNIVKIKSSQTLVDLAKNCPECYQKFLKFAKEKGIHVQADDISEHVEQMRTKMTQTKEMLQNQTQANVEAVETEAALPPKPAIPLPEGMKWFYNKETNTWELIADDQLR